jgi:hypothetical protein
VLEQAFAGQLNARAVGVGIQVAIGWGMILGSHGLARVTTAIRSAPSSSR